VRAGSYPFWEGQEWAEPDIEHAAFLMRKVFNDEGFRKHIAEAGQRYVQEHFNAEVVGRRYASRFAELRLRGFQRFSHFAGRADASVKFMPQPDDEIEGFLDLPKAGRPGMAPQSGTVDIAGWAVSKAGIEKVEIYCDEKFAEEAHYGVLRPDVAEIFPAFSNPGRSGFFSKLDATTLLDGQHVLKVFARSRSGRTRGWEQQFSVVNSNEVYAQWLAKNDLTPEKRRALRAEIDKAPAALCFSIVAMVDAGIDAERLSRTLKSMNGQLYGNWELIICVDSADEIIAKKLLDSSSQRERVSLAGFSVRTWKESFAACRGDYVGVISLGDVLDPRALYAVAKNVECNPNSRLVYADEDRFQGGDRIDPRFKPAWSPIYLQGYNYIGRPWFASAPVLRSIAIDGAQCDDASEHSLLQRLGKTVDKVIHVPMVLCSRHADARPGYAGRGQEGDGGEISGSQDRARRDREQLPLVSVVIPTCLRDLDAVEKCFSSLLMRTDYPNLEVLVVVNNVADAEEAGRYLKRWPFRVLSWDGPFNWSGINNLGARSAAGELLLFLNDDVEALNRNWLTEMVALVSQSSVGAVGATLLYPNGTIQHGGLCLVNYGGGARHFFRFCRGTEAHIAPMASHSRECSAVTGACLLSRRDVFESVNGFDERLPLIANDADYCLRLGEKGYACVVAAGATLVHHEGTSRAGMSETRDVDGFWARWRARLESGDPFSNPNIDDGRDDWRLNPHAICPVNGRVRVGSRRPTVESGS
jgi:GT2 family glycosyltransferase